MQLRNGKVIGSDGIVGYKMACDRRLVILQIPPSARHNIDRSSVINKQFAKHRCSEAFVTNIVDLATGKSVDKAFSIHDPGFEYLVGQRVVPNVPFDEYLDKVCCSGIHFFLDRKRAKLYNSPAPRDGEYKEWNDNGSLNIRCFYKGWKLEGEYKRWNSYGHLETQCFYKDGELDGEYKEWYSNGKIYTHWFYKDGKLDGECKEWYGNGHLKTHCFYKDGKLEIN